MIALLEAHTAGLLARREWPRNLLAGLIVGIVALPLSMAFAIAIGARPEQGLYTAIVAGGLVTALGGSRVQIAGPTGAFVAILSGITAEHGIGGLEVATVMAGCILVVMGLARMGGVIRFIPAPVIVGFTAGIGVIIFVGEWRDFFGLAAVSGRHFHERLVALIAELPSSQPTTVLIGVVSLCALWATPRIPYLRRIPGPLVAMLLATLLQAVFRFPGVATLGTAFGGIPRGLPSFVVPHVTASECLKLVGPAFTIAMLGAIESLLSAVVADGMTGRRHDSNQELVGQGIANVVAPFFGGFAATGAIARTATNVRNGASSPIAGLAHAATLLAVLLVLAPLAAHIPLAALAAILFVVAWNMSEARHFGHLLRTAPRADRAILLITFVLTVFVDLVVAVNVGVILAVLQFMRRMADVVETTPVDADRIAQELGEALVLPPDTLVYDVAGPMFFAVVENFERALLETHTDPKHLIVRLRSVPFIDATGIEALDEVLVKLRGRGIRVVVCEANGRVFSQLERAGVIGRLGVDGYREDLAAAVRTISVVGLE